MGDRRRINAILQFNQSVEQTDFDILTSDTGLEQVERHLDDDPARLAFKLRMPAVTRQIRMLRKCRSKLPSYYAARCIVPPIAYEQASSEATAAARTEGIVAAIPEGERGLAVDLTCGLGVDSLALSRAFGQVTAVEVDPLRTQIARWNFRQLGAENIDVVNAAAEDFLAEWPMDRAIDLVYVDPSRKRADGKRVYSPEESSPDILKLMPSLRKMARRTVVKLSPLFDVAEAYRVFGDDTCVEVISLEGECKEVLAKTGFGQDGGGGGTPYLRVTAIRQGCVQRYDFDRKTCECGNVPAADVGEARFLLVPDVAFYKARAVDAYVSEYLADAPGGLRLSGEYLFADELPEDFAGKTYRITFRHPYQPKEIGRLLRSRGIRRVNVHRRNFPFTSEQIGRALGVELGGSTDIFCTLADGEPTVFFVGRID